MVELQILNKVLKEASVNLFTANGLSVEHFVNYPKEYSFIMDHFNKYKKVPDKETFLAKFQEFQVVDVAESDLYLIETINEERLYYKSVEVINKIAELLQANSNDAVEYLQAKLPELLQQTSTPSNNIIADAGKRLQEWQNKKKMPTKYFIPTGFQELDELIGGWARGEEFALIFARTGHGKTWLLLKALEHAWEQKLRVGLIEPEMSSLRTGYRFDTLNANLSNSALMRGYDVKDYEAHIKNLQTSKIPFYIAHPKDFGRNTTVSKLRVFCQNNKLDILGIDGLAYLKDERRQRGDNKTTALTNICEDLMELSIELGIPIIGVIQSNRGGSKKDDDEGTPDIENIRDSDGPAQNASLIISARQKGPGIEMGIKKNRNGPTGDSIIYFWDIDNGVFKYIPSSGDAAKGKKAEQVREGFKDGSDKF